MCLPENMEEVSGAIGKKRGRDEDYDDENFEADQTMHSLVRLAVTVTTASNNHFETFVTLLFFS
ncbi:hypothetical protein ACLOJK_011463 [Asimina triloba]